MPRVASPMLMRHDGRMARRLVDSSMIHELGDPEGFAVVYHNGTPLSRLIPEWWDAPARERGLRLIGIDRPGYGNAPADPNRSLRSVAETTGAVMDDLGVHSFAVIGASGGGPYALACGAFVPDRVAAIVSAAGSSGFDAALDGASFSPEELELHRDQAVRPTPERRRALARFYNLEIEGLRAADVDGFMTAVGENPTTATPEQRATTGYVLDAIQEAIRPGPDGWLDDGIAAFRPWGFELSDIRAPVAIWHGQDDKLVAIDHGHRLLAGIPNAEPFLVDGLGHGGVCCRQEVPMFDWIASRLSPVGRSD
jgi:pimeloyl-ACP methyl ester carboxylesterase